MDTLTEPRWSTVATSQADWAPEGRREILDEHDCTGEHGAHATEVLERVMAEDDLRRLDGYPEVLELPPLARPCVCGDDVLDHPTRFGVEEDEGTRCVVAGCGCPAYEEDPDPSPPVGLTEIVGPELAARIEAQAAAEHAERSAAGTLPVEEA